MRNNYLFIILQTTLLFLLKCINNLPILNITERIYSNNPFLSRTKDMEIWGNKSIKWIDKMQQNTVLLDNLLVYTGGCNIEKCACPSTYASIKILNETLIFDSKWTLGKVSNFGFKTLFIPNFNIEKHIRFDFSVDAYSFMNGKHIWNLNVKQGEYYFKNPLYKKCSFTYEIFYPEEYITNRQKELNEILHSFYNDNQARFAEEHVKEIDRQKKNKL